MHYEADLLNQNPEQVARDKIDALLKASGWDVQSKDQVNLNRSMGVALREYQTDTGVVDYLLMVNKIPVGVLEAKKRRRSISSS